MTALATAPAKHPPAVKPAPKARPQKGAAPVKKPVKRASTGAKRAPAGARESVGGVMRRELAREGDGVGITVLIRQAARVADRLENIDKVLAGDIDTWIKVGIPRSDSKRGRVVIEVRVDDLVKEERAQTTLLRHLLAEIYRQRSGLPPAVSSDEEDDLAIE